jgi:hypothetical protein
VYGFWWHVIDGPDLESSASAGAFIREIATYLYVSLNIDSVIGYGLGDPEIDNLQTPLDKHEVGWFKIRMNHLLLVYRLNGF